MVFAEASSFGVPSLATNVGGIPTAIKDGLNGKTFQLCANAENDCGYVLDLFLISPIGRRWLHHHSINISRVSTGQQPGES